MSQPQSDKSSASPASNQSTPNPTASTTTEDQASKVAHTGAETEEIMESVCGKAEKIDDLLDTIAKNSPKSPLTINAYLELLGARTTFGRLRTEMERALADLTVSVGPHISTMKGETGTVIGGFEKDLDAVQKKLEDLQAGH